MPKGAFERMLEQRMRDPQAALAILRMMNPRAGSVCDGMDVVFDAMLAIAEPYRAWYFQAFSEHGTLGLERCVGLSSFGPALAERSRCGTVCVAIRATAPEDAHAYSPEQRHDADDLKHTKVRLERMVNEVIHEPEQRISNEAEQPQGEPGHGAPRRPVRIVQTLENRREQIPGQE